VADPPGPHSPDDGHLALPLDFSQGMPPRLLVANTDSLGEQINARSPTPAS
jgi:hypothetical protein